VLAVSDVEECFYLTAEALKIAEEYQTPVILLTDKHLAESHQTTPMFDQSKIEIRRGKIIDPKKLHGQVDFKRYDTSARDGISPRSLPGMKGGIYLANSDEHDEYGYTLEESEGVVAMFDKRQRKLEAFRKAMPQPALQGSRDAEITFVTWGSTKGAVKEAIRILETKKISANFLNITWMSPFPKDTVLSILKKAKRPILVEANLQGQLGDVIAEQTGFFFKEKILKYDGRPFFPEEIVEGIKNKRNGNR
jgi:2-oxoglutarate ferredoxin oxidoreductase subunit alpha